MIKWLKAGLLFWMIIGDGPGCREAVTDYLKEHQIQGVVLKQVDLHGVYFQKPPRCRGETADN